MDFRIADPSTDSLARLTGEEQKAVKTRPRRSTCGKIPRTRETAPTSQGPRNLVNGPADG